MTPVVSAELTDSGVIVTVVSSATPVVRSPLFSSIRGARLATGAPAQSVTLTFTGSTWPFFSLSVTGWFVIGGRKLPEPIPTVVSATSEAPPSSSVTCTLAHLHPAEANLWVTAWPLTKGDTVCVTGDPSCHQKSAFQV